MLSIVNKMIEANADFCPQFAIQVTFCPYCDLFLTTFSVFKQETPQSDIVLNIIYRVKRRHYVKSHENYRKVLLVQYFVVPDYQR